ncbi:MAG: mechanosensitive ion channel family protein [Oligoflexus sp.]
MSFQEVFSEYPLIAAYSLFLGVIVLAWISFFICRAYVLKFIRLLTKDISNLWAQAFFDQRFFSQLAWIVPNLIIHYGTKAISGLPSVFSILVQRIALATLIILILRAITILFRNLNHTYSQLEMAKNRPIKGLLQVVTIILYILGFILMISILMDRSPWVFLSGLGAMTAVLLLIFRDTILSLVAGIQLTTNNFISVGDWIEMPQFGADGDVVDIALHAVRVQNWDKTITIIPTHKFLENSFKNWRGMQESGGRRIKRAVHVDMSSIRFLQQDEIKRLERFVLLKDYIQQKCAELEEHNSKFAHDPQLIVNARRLTNIGTFRAYLVNYLRQHPHIHQNMTFLVRQLAPGDHGLPIEIYVFTNDIRWAVYESIQADIFDHILAIAAEFGLHIFQNPTGFDVRAALQYQRQMDATALVGSSSSP